MVARAHSHHIFGYTFINEVNFHFHRAEVGRVAGETLGARGGTSVLCYSESNSKSHTATSLRHACIAHYSRCVGECISVENEK